MGSQHYSGFASINYPGGGDAADFMESNKVLSGCLLYAPTTGSTQVIATPIHDFNVNLAQGIISVDGVVSNVAAAADINLSAAGTAPLASGQSVIYCLIYYRSRGDGLVKSSWVAGTVAVHATVVRPTIAQIKTALGLDDDHVWFCLGETRIKCTGAATVTQEYNNATRPFMIPDQPIPILQG
jgi:hypothetical protein